MRLIGLLMVATLCGCTKWEEQKPGNATAASNQTSSDQLAIDGLTGKASVDAYKHARKTLDKANEVKRRNLESAEAAEQP